MADIQYLNYGDQQIEQQALLNALSNDVQEYVQNKPWSKKRKEKFMSAYSDLMNKGILGASNNTGQWMIDVNGDIPFDTMDKKDKEMYGEAAYFIQQKMAGLPTKASQEQSKEEEKKNLPLFDNAYFTRELGNYISTKEFGGRPIDTQTDWNSLDKRDPIKGTRGRAERAATLARNLKSYADSLDESKLNFEGSPFENLNDFKTRVNNAIKALNTPDESDDTQALNAIGLRASDWFNDGSGDPVTVTLDDGTQQTTTYGQLAEYNKKIEEDKQKKEQEQKLAQQELIKQKYAQKIANSYDGAMRSSSSLIGTDIKKLASKYTNDQNLKKQLSDYSKSQNLDRSQWEEIVGAFQFYNSKGALQNLSRDELNKFERLVGYRGLAPSVLKKLPGVDGFYFDTRTNQVIRPYKKDQQNLLSSQDLLEQYNPEHLQQQYMNSTEGGFTPQERNEVIALLFDLGAAIDPEGITSAGLSQIAAGFRDYNRANDPEGWTLGDTGWAALDHGLGLLSAIPFVGGLIKGSWAAAKLGSYIPKMEKWIRLAGRAGSTAAMATNASGALNTLNKIKNGEDLSLKDYQDLAYFFIGGLGHHQLNRGNRVERSAMKARGIETSNSILNRTGFTRTKAKTTSSSETTPTLKVQKTGEDGKVDTKEIPITKEQEAALRKAKPDKLNEVVAEAKINNIPEGYKIVEPTMSPGWRGRINAVKNRLGKGNSEIFGTPINNTRNSSALKTDEEFEQYLSEHNNTWLKKIFNGSNRDIRRYDRYLGNNSIKSTTEQQSETPKVESTNELYNKNVQYEYNILNTPNKNRSKLLQKGDSQSANLIDGNTYRFVYSNEGEAIVMLNGKPVLNPIKVKNQKEAKEIFSKFVKDLNSKIASQNQDQFLKRFESKKYLESIRELKRKGFFLKQGGTIDKQKIQKYKEFIKK